MKRMKKYNIKTINTLSELKKAFNFISLVFYNDACENSEHYYNMGERYDEMKKMQYIFFLSII